ncbi:MAG: S1 RNA-binding domain-containing protein [Patescibacteria group bacterium]
MTHTYFEEATLPLVAGANAEGTVIDIDKNSMYIDLSPYGTGIVFGREFLSIKDIIKTISVGDSIIAQVIETEGYEGYIELSLKEARKATIWQEAEDARTNSTVLSLVVKEANKGGLMIQWQGITGFLPASQLGNENYPKVSGGDKNRILMELEKLVGEKLDVQIISVDPAEEKLIFSEKKDKGHKANHGDSYEGRTAIDTDLTEVYKIGDILDGEVTGAVEFGVFVKIAEGLEGLVHISELSWSLVENPETLYQIGEKVRVKIIDVTPDKVSLSIKALSDSPWKSAEQKYEKGMEVQAIVIRYNEHGALVSVEEGVAGLVHISDFENMSQLREKLSLGMAYTFKINAFDAAKEKMTLSLVA